MVLSTSVLKSAVLLLLAACMTVLVDVVESTNIVQTRGSIGRREQYTVTYDADAGSGTLCDVVVMIGVGTNMSHKDYDSISTLISTDHPSIVTVIFDHNPRNMVKFGRNDYANFFNVFTSDLNTHIPVCHDTNELYSPKIIIGGHSASGRAGFQALMHDELERSVDGYISLDGYSVSRAGQWGIGWRNIPPTSISDELPVLSWGFETRTCGADVAMGGKAAYELSHEEHRVFFRARNSEGRVGHCEFTDRGCFAVCFSRSPQNDNVRNIIAKSIQTFAAGVVQGREVTPSDYEDLDLSNDSVIIDVFVNTDTVQ